MKTNSLTNQEPMDWEKEFEKEFTCLGWVPSHRVVGYWDDNATPQFISAKKMKDFISKWLRQEREIGRKEIKDKLIKAVMGKKYHTLESLMTDLYDLIT